MSNIVQQLRDRLAEHPNFAKAFELSFLRALAMKIPQFAEHNITTLSEYIDFYESMLTWTPSEITSGKNIYYNLCLFYFVIDLAPVKFQQNPILPTESSPWKWLSEWLICYAQELGKFMDTPESISEASLATFYEAQSYHMEDYPIPSGGWKTFNQFFARHINPAVRPIDSPADPTVIVSPADSTFDGSWPINSDAEVTTFTSKNIPWSISQLLQDSLYGEKFKGGIFMHAFLAPSDYHRQHAPVAGKVLEAKVIPGLCYLQVVAEEENGKLKLNMRRSLHPTPEVKGGIHGLEAPDDPGYQFLQARGLVVLDNPDIGLVAVLPIGMAQVSSVVLSVKPGDVLKKGDEISYFQMGGSDIVVVFEAASKVNITAAKDVHYKFGNQIATAQRIYK